MVKTTDRLEELAAELGAFVRERVEKELKPLLELRDYASHKKECEAAMVRDKEWCTCGLDDLLARTEP